MDSERTPTSKPERSSARLWRIGSVLGVPIFITPSWVLVVCFITVTYADLLHRRVLNSSVGLSYVLALSYALLLAVSIVLHEVGHTLTCRALGLPVRRIVVFLLGGVSEIVGSPRRPRDEFSIAAAGPLVSFLLAGGCWLLGLLASGGSAAGVLIALLGWSNLIIAVFNVLPGLPLDGGRLVQAVIWGAASSRLRGIRVATWCGRVLAVLLALGSLLATSGIGLRSSQQQSTGFAAIVAAAAGFAVAAFIYFGAGQALHQAELIQRAQALTLGTLTRRAIYVSAHTPVAEALRQLNLRSAGAIVLVDSEGRSSGIVAESVLRRLDAGRRPWTTVSELAVGLHPSKILPSTLTGEALLEAVSSHPASEYLVLGPDGFAAGVLAASDLTRALGKPAKT